MTAVAQQTRSLRASSLRDCARKAAYEAEGAPARERTLAEERTLYRGKSLGREWLIMFASTQQQKIFVESGESYWVPPHLRAESRDDADVIAEQRVEWELGTGHMDAFVVETGAVIEVLSSAHASEAMIRSKLLQCVLYMEHYEPAQVGALVVLSPTDLSEDIHPIARSSSTYAELVGEMRDRVAAVRAWHETGELPARVCVKPQDARSHFCLHAAHCFANWEAPDPDLVLTTGEASETAAAVYRAKQAERARKEAYDTAVSVRKEHEQRLADLIDLARAGGAAKKVRVGALEVNRIEVADHQELALKKARTAGVWTDGHDELFGDFLALKGGHVRFQVDRVSDGPLESFGEDAPF